MRSGEQQRSSESGCASKYRSFVVQVLANNQCFSCTCHLYWSMTYRLPSSSSPHSRLQTETIAVSDNGFLTPPSTTVGRHLGLYVLRMSFRFWRPCFSGGACFPPRWCKLLIGRLLRDARMQSRPGTVRVDHIGLYPTRIPGVLDDAYPWLTTRLSLLDKNIGTSARF